MHACFAVSIRKWLIVIDEVKGTDELNVEEIRISFERGKPKVPLIQGLLLGLYLSWYFIQYESAILLMITSRISMMILMKL